MNTLPRRRLIALGLLPLLAQPPRARPSQASAPWAAWGDAAWEGAQAAVRQWQLQAELHDVMIMGPNAIGGHVVGPSLRGLIAARMQARGVPDDVAQRFAGAVAAAWTTWHEALRVPGLPWYPAFAAFPGPKAVPTPNVPTPLAALVSAQASQLAKPALSRRIVAALGPHAQRSGAAAAVEQFAQRFGTRFSPWRAAVVVKGVIGSGPVPSFKPPLAPAGPVVGGKIVETPGVFATPLF